MSDTYARFGVNIKEGDVFSAFAGEICAASYQNSPFVEVTDFSRGHFRGPKGFRFVNLPEEYWQDGAPDGIGTKVVPIDAANGHPYAARDVFAMTGGDITRFGGKPLVFLNVLDVSTLGETGSPTNNACREMMVGLSQVAREQQVVLYRGETAELGICVGSENPRATVKFNWAGFMLGAFLPDRIITGETLEEGQAVVALREAGPRSNGLSKVRGGLRAHYGDKWWDNPDALADIHAAATPSTLYDRFLADANGWTNPVTTPRFKMHLIAHISGGGIVDKFGRDILFRYGFSAELTNLFAPPGILHKVMKWTGAEEHEAYRTFSSGNGALVVLDTTDVDPFVSMASGYGIEAKWCGSITKSTDPCLRIISCYSGRDLYYHPE